MGEPNNSIRAAIMAAVVAVFAGYLLLWIMMPTNTYRHVWFPEVRNRTATTYFGTYQGGSFLLYNFPPLLIAVLGCLYIHLLRKPKAIQAKRESDGEDDNMNKPRIWKKPMIIKGLGIVSLMELAFLAMFIALLVWSYATFLRTSFRKITPQSARLDEEKVWEEKLESASFWLGIVGNIALCFLFYPVTRGSSVLPLFGLTSEGSIKYHIWLGHIMMILFTSHGLGYVVYWASTHELSEMLQWQKTGVANLPGELSLLAGIVLWAATFPGLRRIMFELFFYTHHLYILFIIFYVLHVGIGCTTYMLPGFFLFMIDRYLRFLQSRSNIRLISARVLPCETVEMIFSKSKSLNYNPTSIIFINVPTISMLQWHPFTVSSSSVLESDKLSVIIKSEGKWSNKLYKMLSSDSPINRLQVAIEGPYGPASTDFLRYDLLVMVSGGSGITPFISIIRELIYTSETLKEKTPEIMLISSFKNSIDLTMLDLILPITGTPLKFSNLSLQIEAYVTRENQPTTQEKKRVRTVWFKSDPSDAPITPTLGKNSWLWLAAIISSSFIIYLIFIGILTRYYIFPIDHNTNEIYSSSKKVVLHSLFICIGIVLASTLAFLWNKKENEKETTQIQNMEDTELESSPKQSLSQAVHVHYGKRPKLDSILLQRKESSIGVLVCGPKEMRHQVASICSSGSATNLHFESISFSW